MGLFAALVLAGCASTRVAPSVYDAHIRKLNASTAENREARKQLKAAGADAIPRLLQEVDRSASYLRNPGNSLAAMRALRVLRDIETPKALPACRRLLTDEYFPPKSKQEAALLNEALEVVYDNFKEAEARDIFYEFISGDSSRYVRRIRKAQHWGPAVYRPRVEVDVVRGIRLMVNVKDDRAGDALASFLKSIDIGSLRRTYYHRLAENGYVITEAATGKAGNALQGLSIGASGK